MSRSTLLVAREDGRFAQGFEYANSWLGAAAIWTRLFDTYVPKRTPYDSWLGDEGGRLWALINDERLTADERIALAITFDNCVIGRDEMPRVADALDNFGKHLANSHLPMWAARLREFARDPTVRGVAFHHTSVTSNPWWDVTDEESGEGEPYSLDSGTPRHWFIFAQYPQLESATKADAVDPHVGASSE